jgi:hypothetical protein
VTFERITTVELHSLTLRGSQILKCTGNLEKERTFWLADIGCRLFAAAFRFLGEEHGLHSPESLLAHHYTLIGVKEASSELNGMSASVS